MLYVEAFQTERYSRAVAELLDEFGLVFSRLLTERYRLSRGKMPKIPKESASSFVWRMKETFPTELHVDDDCNLNCIHCKLPIPVRTFFQVKQHLQTAKHRQNAGRNEILAVQNSNGTSSPQVDLATQELLQFNRDLFAMLQSAAIPISKVSNQKFTQFIEKYTRYTLPNELTLHQTCAFAAYGSCITKLKCKASNAYIWVSLSETTDSKERKIINFVFGILGERSEHGKSYLLNIQVLKEVNEDAIVKFFTDSLQLIWPRGKQYFLFDNQTMKNE